MRIAFLALVAVAVLALSGNDARAQCQGGQCPLKVGVPANLASASAPAYIAAGPVARYAPSQRLRHRRDGGSQFRPAAYQRRHRHR